MVSQITKRERRRTRVAVGMSGLGFLLMAIAVIYGIAGESDPIPANRQLSQGIVAIGLLMALVFGSIFFLFVGSLLMDHTRTNRGK